jgi:hypothetical protein
MSKVELSTIPFKCRMVAGLGFLVVGVAGLAGTARECGAAFSTSWSATSAEWGHRPTAADTLNDEHGRHQLAGGLDGLTAGLSLAAGARLMRGGYSYFMRLEGQWAWQAEVAAPQPTNEAVTAKIGQVAIADEAARYNGFDTYFDTYIVPGALDLNVIAGLATA